MPEENTDIKLTVDAWAEIVMKQWINKILALDIIDSHALYDSFVHHITSNAGGDIQKIEFAFNYYGKFIDMGVGRGQPIGTPGERTPKKWFSATFFANQQKLKELLAKKYAIKAKQTIIDAVE